MSTYPGNPSLATAVKDRVASTFEQALSLFKLGRTEEVIAGCTLILQMDPMFDPAKKLLEKAKNPSSPIDISSLIPGAAGGSELQEAREALAARDFQRVVNITTDILTNDLMNDEARILGDEAREKMEAAPFIDQFAKKCEQQLAAGNISGASTALEKMRSLDPTHPTVIRLAQAISGRQPAAAAPAAAPSFGFDNSTSFVVDAPSAPAGGRAPAPAADFGFTFEEDKGGAAPAFNFDASPPPAAPAAPAASSSFSFDTPAAGSGGFSFDAPAAGGGFSFDSGAQAQSGGGFSFDAKQPNAGEFDFSSAASQTSPDDLKKIEQYLADGDGAAAAGDYQQAIDLWSRIFLIDVTNEQASERIERAKMKKREAEDKAEPALAAAIQAFDRKDFDTARVKFNDVLRIDPSNESALSYMNRLPEPAAGRPSTPPPAGAKTAAAPPAAAPPRDILEDDEFSGTYEPVLPPEPVAAPKTEKKGDKKAAPAKKSSKGLPVVPIVAVVALLVVIAGGWFAWSKFAKPSYDPKQTEATFNQAGVLAKQGKYDEAISLLQDVKPEDPQHDKAVIMIADLQQKKSKGNEMIDGKPAAVYFNEQINNGRTAFASHDYDGAKKSFEAAMRVKQMPADVKAMYDTAAQQVAKLDGAKSLFHERRYQDALGNLVPLLDQDPQNQNIRRMIIDAHFNIGAQDLQQERLDEASKEFDEVLKMDPADELAKKSKELAARYNGQPKDLLYKIYVKYLPLRQAS